LSSTRISHGSTLDASGIDYGMLTQAGAMKRLKELETLAPS